MKYYSAYRERDDFPLLIHGTRHDLRNLLGKSHNSLNAALCQIRKGTRDLIVSNNKGRLKGRYVIYIEEGK